jgi:hypothetical protein
METKTISGAARKKAQKIVYKNGMMIRLLIFGFIPLLILSTIGHAQAQIRSITHAAHSCIQAKVMLSLLAQGLLTSLSRLYPPSEAQARQGALINSTIVGIENCVLTYQK